MKRICCSLAFCFVFLNSLLAQNHSIKGVVRDAGTQLPLPFVSILINEGPNGAASDISGKFEVKNNGPVTQLTFSYVGYEAQSIGISGQEKELQIQLQPKTSNLREVVIRAGYNPAHRIIKLASENRKNNDAGQLPQFTYRVYNKTYATFPPEAFSNKPNAKAERNPFENSYLFFSESLADHAFLKPDLHQETVLA